MVMRDDSKPVETAVEGTDIAARIIDSIDKRVRNLEKRNAKLDTLKASKGPLNDDQKKALDNKPLVEHELDALRDVRKNIVQVKVQHKQMAHEAALRRVRAQVLVLSMTEVESAHIAQAYEADEATFVVRIAEVVAAGGGHGGSPKALAELARIFHALFDPIETLYQVQLKQSVVPGVKHVPLLRAREIIHEVADKIRSLRADGTNGSSELESPVVALSPVPSATSTTPNTVSEPNGKAECIVEPERPLVHAGAVNVNDLERVLLNGGSPTGVASAPSPPPPIPMPGETTKIDDNCAEHDNAGSKEANGSVQNGDTVSDEAMHSASPDVLSSAAMSGTDGSLVFVSSHVAQPVGARPPSDPEAVADALAVANDVETQVAPMSSPAVRPDGRPRDRRDRPNGRGAARAPPRSDGRGGVRGRGGGAPSTRPYGDRRRQPRINGNDEEDAINTDGVTNGDDGWEPVMRRQDRRAQRSSTEDEPGARRGRGGRGTGSGRGMGERGRGGLSVPHSTSRQPMRGGHGDRADNERAGGAARRTPAQRTQPAHGGTQSHENDDAGDPQGW